MGKAKALSSLKFLEYEQIQTRSLTPSQHSQELALGLSKRMDCFVTLHCHSQHTASSFLLYVEIIVDEGELSSSLGRHGGEKVITTIAVENSFSVLAERYDFREFF